MQKHPTSRQFFSFALLSLGSVVTIFYAMAASAERPVEEKGGNPELTQFEYECWIEQHCGTDPPIDIVGMGSHPNNAALAKAEALANAEANCETSCFDTPLFCCTDANPASPCTLGPRYVPIVSYLIPPGASRIQAPHGLRFEFFGVGKNGKVLYAGSPRPVGSDYPFEQAREDAWKRFLLQVTKNEGLAEGTLKTRVAQAAIYRCYVRVVSKYEKTHYDQQVEGQDYSRRQASDAAQSAATRLMQVLETCGHTDIEIKSERCAVEVNKFGANKPTAVSRHQCQTTDGWTVIVARRDRIPAAARGASLEAAKLIADHHYGGATYCQELPSLNSVSAAASGCVDCGEGAVAADPAVKGASASTDTSKQ